MGEEAQALIVHLPKKKPPIDGGFKRRCPGLSNRGITESEARAAFQFSAPNQDAGKTLNSFECPNRCSSTGLALFAKFLSVQNLCD
jgi:hypothetical protein